MRIFFAFILQEFSTFQSSILSVNETLHFHFTYLIVYINTTRALQISQRTISIHLLLFIIVLNIISFQSPFYDSGKSPNYKLCMKKTSMSGVK